MQHTWVSMYCSHPLCSIDLPVISKAVLHISHFLQQLLNCIHWNGNAIVVSINSAAIVIYKIRLEQSTPQYVFLCIINSSLHLAKACFWVAILICFNRCLKNTKWSLTNKLKKITTISLCSMRFSFGWKKNALLFSSSFRQFVGLKNLRYLPTALMLSSVFWMSVTWLFWFMPDILYTRGMQ